MPSTSFTSFDSAVRDICNAANDPAAKNYVRMARILKTELRSLNMLILPTGIVSKKMTVNDSLTIPLNDDVLKVYSVGLINGTGRPSIIREMDVEDQEEIESCSCGEVDTTTDPATWPICARHTFHNCGEYEFYGYYTETSVGGWRHDRLGARLLFTGISAGSKVLVKYRSSKNDMILVPVDGYKLIEAKTLTTFYKSIDRGLSNDWWNTFGMELQYYKEINHPWDWDQIYDAIYGSAKRAKQ